MPRPRPPAPIRYSIIPSRPAAHLFEVTLTVDDPPAEGVRVALPAWIPGSYLLRDFARHIVSIKASANDRAVRLTKIDQHTWQAPPCDGPLVLTYEVYAWDLSVRAAHLDETHAFFNGTSVFLRVLGLEERPCVVDIHPPAGLRYSDWRVATALREARGAGGAKRHGFGLYEAANYDELIDHPVELGRFTLLRFNACGVPHEVAITGRVPNLDEKRLTNDIKRICEAQIRLFEPKTEQAPVDRYVFLVTAVGDGYGGLEHRASTALLCSRNDLPVLGQHEFSEAYRGFLGLVSHEYFHTWNVKRIKPQAFASYDLQAGNATRLLWIFEGFTSYYDDLTLVRTGLLTREQYFKNLAKTINDLRKTPGRLRHSVADASFDAWTKYYRPDENSPNATISYYAKGSLVALALDLYIRTQTQGRRSLDDVMRVLWREYGRDFYNGAPRGLAEDGFVDIAQAATGVSLAKQVRDWAYGTTELPLEKLFDAMGIEWRDESAKSSASLDIKIRARNGDCVIATAYEGGAAQRAGLSADDVLVAIDGLRVTDASLPKLLARYKPSQRAAVHAFRRDELHLFEVEFAAALSSISLGSQDKPDRAALKQQRVWLGSNAD
ncbi:MAG TPA: PDZ domain-containing protein [Burkholderiaceae bacterium]|nr:PDZ domain-containing protein [Burkholderiaceae bacterium]